MNSRTLVAVSHGTDSQPGAAAIAALVQAAARELPQTRTLEAFVDVQQPDLPKVLEQAGDRATIVPLLLSTGYHVRQDIADSANASAVTNIDITRALGPDPRLAKVLHQRLIESSWTPGDHTILVAAGSSDDRAVAEVQEQADMLRALIGELDVAFLSAAEPKLKDLVPRIKFKHPRKKIVVATYLLAPGFFAGLAAKSGAHIVSEPLLTETQEPPREIVELLVERFNRAVEPGGTTGCLQNLRNLKTPFECAAGCAVSCR